MFKVINPNDATFAAIKAAAATAATRLDYNTLADQFNSAEVNGMLAFEYKVGKIAALRVQLERRGLKNGIDFVAVGTKIEGVEHAVVTRLSSTKASQVESKQRGPRGPRKPKEGAAPAPAAPTAPAAKPAPAAPKA